jgi:hypothetical protein
LYCIPKIVWVMKSGRIEWVGHVAGMVEGVMPRNTHEDVYL